MTNQLVCVSVNMHVDEARRTQKEHIDAPDFAHFLYVIDSEETCHLDGVVTMRAFAVADDAQGSVNS